MQEIFSNEKIKGTNLHIRTLVRGGGDDVKARNREDERGREGAASGRRTFRVGLHRAGKGR